MDASDVLGGAGRRGRRRIRARARAKRITLEERNLFSVAVRNVVGAKRASLRVLDSAVMEEDEAAADSASGSAAHVVATERAERCREYIGRVTLELE